MNSLTIHRWLSRKLLNLAKRYRAKYPDPHKFVLPEPLGDWDKILRRKK